MHSNLTFFTSLLQCLLPWIDDCRYSNSSTFTSFLHCIFTFYLLPSHSHTYYLSSICFHSSSLQHTSLFHLLSTLNTDHIVACEHGDPSLTSSVNLSITTANMKRLPDAIPPHIYLKLATFFNFGKTAE